MENPRINQLFSLLEKAPQDVFLNYALAMEYLSVENWKEAAAYLEQVKHLDPDYLALYYHLGKVQIQLGAIEDASTTFREGIKLANKLKDFKTKAELWFALTALTGEEEDDGI